ncbi:MAG: radical SAM protein [Patescibacteria group bacterium]|nr:radical SAM protein [Patescibacteria group bacterium]
MKLLDKIKIIKNYWPVSKFYFHSLLKRNKPLFGLFFQVTDRCNAKCLMCFNWKKINKKSDELSLDEIQKFTKTIGHLSNLVLGGGEPFLRNDLTEICQIFSKNNGVRKIGIPTNCLSTDKIIDSSKKILESCSVKLKIVLSLDGLEKTHDHIRGIKGNFNKVLETYKELDLLREKYPRLQLSINTTISNENEDNIPEIIDFVDKNFNIQFHTLELIRGCYNQKNVQAPSLSKYQELIKYIFKSKNIDKNIYHKAIYSYYHKITADILKEKRQLIPCRVSSFMPVIDATGNVYNCELLPKIGNLKDVNFDFSKIWNSQIAKQQRKDITNKKCYCTHYCYQIQNIVISPYHFLKAISK